MVVKSLITLFKHQLSEQTVILLCTFILLHATMIVEISIIIFWWSSYLMDVFHCLSTSVFCLDFSCITLGNAYTWLPPYSFCIHLLMQGMFQFHFNLNLPLNHEDIGLPQSLLYVAHCGGLSLCAHIDYFSWRTFCTRYSSNWCNKKISNEAINQYDLGFLSNKGQSCKKIEI